MKKITAVIVIFAIAAYIVLQKYGDNDQVVGMSTFGLFIFLTALVFFLKGTRPFIGDENRKTVRLVRLGIGCLVFSALLIPFWSLITWRFPPDGFNMATALMATASLLIAVFGSAAPTIQRLVSGFVELNRIQKAEIKIRKSSRQGCTPKTHSPSAPVLVVVDVGLKNMKTDDKPVSYDDFLHICHAAKDRFAFLETMGLRLTKEQWPNGDSFKDGFQLTYTASVVSVAIEYYDVELVIWFLKERERVPYLFIDQELASNRSGFAGCMFPRNKLAEAVFKMAEDIRLNYGHILNGDKDVWTNIVALWHAPREKRRLP